MRVTPGTSALALRRGQRTVLSLSILFLLLGPLASVVGAGAQGPTALVTEVDGVITPVIADHLREGLTRAEKEGHHVFLIEFDTPGGLDTSMRDIIKAFLGADVAVVVHVAPSGARAASAGALITMSAHIAAMAPGTAIGAATPIDLEGGEDVEQKIIEDAAAYAKSVARARERNTEFAEDAVREGRSVTAEEAERTDVVDLLAPNRTALLEAIDGETVTMANGSELTLNTRDVEIVPYEMGTFRSVLQWLTDPNLAFLFMSIGTLAIIYELANPGLGGGAVVGVILILLALFALAVLPVNALGALLLGLAAIMFVVEIFTPGIGVGAAGGTASLVLGGLFLFRGRVEVDLEVLIPVAIVVGGATVLAGRLAWRTRRLAPTTGEGGLLGSVAVVRSASGTSGQGMVGGAWWNLTTKGEQLREGATVRVVDVEGLNLVVEEQESPQPQEDEETKERGEP
ncbi:MAG: nodulation protein NfeD [Actinomycetota bacterium]|nr:nodulation protein NfeD [Actinomycetota bacterium]